MDNTMFSAEALTSLAWIGLLVGVEYICVLVALLIDLRSGTLKAARRGERRTSGGYRRTVRKASGYFCTLAVCTVVDFILVLSAAYLRWRMNMDVPVFPLLTTVGAVGMSAIEVKSVMESADTKTDAEHLARDLMELLDDPRMERLFKALGKLK